MLTFLNRECNSRGNVRHVSNEFFAAVMFHIFWIWKTEKKTIKDSGFLIKGTDKCLTIKHVVNFLNYPAALLLSYGSYYRL